MSDMLGQFTRRQRARKEHRCDLARDCVIKPGDVYIIGVTLPGESSYPIGDGDYESVDWPFTFQKACFDHYNAMHTGEL